MRIDFAVACDYALIDRFGKLSVLGIFQHVWVATFPAVHPRTHLVIRLKGELDEVGEHDVSITFEDDDGNVLIDGNGTVTLGDPPPGVPELEAGAVLVFDLPLQRPGQYWFRVVVDDEVESNVSLTAGSSGDHGTSDPRFLN